MAAMALVCTGAFTAACQDWDDHYEAAPSLGESNITLWENIKTKHPELSNFATLLEKVGYDSLLSTSQSFTVWAPTNDELNFDSLNRLTIDTLREEFVKNHIARSNFVATGDLDEDVFMLSKKVLSFKQENGTFTMDNIPVAQANIGSSNGVLHTMSSHIPYLQNIFESLNTHTGPIGAFSDYFHSFDDSVFVPSASVVGPIQDGQITYLDSIFRKTNSLYGDYQAFNGRTILNGGGNYIAREDSSYTMIVPTDNAWNGGKESIGNYFNYVSDIVFDDCSETARMSATMDTIKFNADSLKELAVQSQMMRNLIFNNNSYLNKKLVDFQPGNEFGEKDSLVSSYCEVLYKEDADYLFEGAKRYDKSNGSLWITDNLNLRPWNGWAPIIKIEAEVNQNIIVGSEYDIVTDGVTNVNKNENIKGSVSNGRYAIISSASGTAPIFDVYLPFVMSTEYAIYAVTIPSNIKNAGGSDEDVLPYGLQTTVSYHKADGKLNGTTTFKDGKRTRTGLDNLLNADGSTPSTRERTKVSEAGVIDTLLLGYHKFPVCYYGLDSYAVGNICRPSLHIQARTTGYKNGKSVSCDSEVRLDCILLVPRELQEYLKAHPEYMKEARPEYQYFATH